MHTISWTCNLVSELDHIIRQFVVQNSQEPLGPGRWSQWLQWSSCGTCMAHKGYFTYSCMYICNKSIRSSAQYLTLQKIFLTSKFGYFLFCIPTLKLTLNLHRQGFFILVKFCQKATQYCNNLPKAIK